MVSVVYFCLLKNAATTETISLKFCTKLAYMPEITQAYALLDFFSPFQNSCLYDINTTES